LTQQLSEEQAVPISSLTIKVTPSSAAEGPFEMPLGYTARKPLRR
jgi:hypothetical protein